MSGLLYDLLSDRVLLIRDIKEVFSTWNLEKNFTLVIFLTWMVKNQQHLIECINQLDPTGFYGLGNKDIGECVARKTDLRDDFELFVKNDETINIMIDVTNDVIDIPAFNFHYYLGILIKNTNWWHRNEEVIQKSSNHNKNRAKIVRGISES